MYIVVDVDMHLYQRVMKTGGQILLKANRTLLQSIECLTHAPLLLGNEAFRIADMLFCGLA